MVRSANITPDSETGIDSWTKETFFQRFRQFAEEELNSLKPGEFNTIMPWSLYASMMDDDLMAIYKYLMSLEPQKNLAVRFVRLNKMADSN